MALTKETTNLFADLCIGIASFASPAFASIAPVVAPLAAFASMGLHLKDGSAKLANEKAQKAVIKALKGHAEFSDDTLTRTASLLNDAKSPLTLSAETLKQAAKSGSFEATVIAHLLKPLPLDTDESLVKHILETALHAGLSACRKDETFHQALTQELLIDAAKMANVQLETLDEIKADTTEIKARLDELTLQNGTLAKALDTLESQSKDQLEALASRFEIPRAYDMSTEQLQAELNARAEDYRTYRAAIEAIDERTNGLGNLKAAAAEAADRLDFEEVENLLSMVDATETEIAAQGKEIRARNALIRGKAGDAFTILSAAADSFASLHPHAPSAKRTEGGGTMLSEAVNGFRAALIVRTKVNHPMDWATTQNNLAAALRNLAAHTPQGADGATLLSEAVTAFRAALTVRTKAEHPVDWAGTQNNLANALRDQANCTQGESGAKLLSEAATAFRAALTVRTKAEHPVDWAMTQNNLAATLGDQANCTEGEGGAKLLAEAVEAYHAALTVRSKTNQPMGWAETTFNLAILEVNHAQHNSSNNPRPHLQAALAYVEEALTVFDPVHMTPNHAKATRLREVLLQALSD